MSRRTVSVCLFLAAALAVLSVACLKLGKQEKSVTGALYVTLTNGTGEPFGIVKGELTLVPELGGGGESVQLESAVTQDRRGIIVPPIVVAGDTAHWPQKFEISLWLNSGDIISCRFQRSSPESALNETVTAVSREGCEYQVGVIEKPPVVNEGR